MHFCAKLFLWLGICCAYHCMPVHGRDLPSAVPLGGAIVAAVEHEAEQEDAALELAQERKQLWRILSGDADVNEMETMLKDITEARGHKHKKMLKMMYPILVGLLIAKVIVIPMILKFLTALSTSAFVMAKIAFFAAGLLALKLVFTTGDGGHERLSIIRVPAAVKAYHSDWDDLSPSGSAWLDLKLPASKQKYIPLGIGGAKEPTGYNHYPQHSYDSYYDAKPFL